MKLLERLAEIFNSLEWPDPKPTESFVIEDQIGVLKAIAHMPGSIIKVSGAEDGPYRAGKPLRYRTVQRLLVLEQLTAARSPSGSDYITLSPQGWDRLMDVDRA